MSTHSLFPDNGSDMIPLFTLDVGSPTAATQLSIRDGRNLTASTQSREELCDKRPCGCRRLRAERSPTWVAQTAGRVQAALEATFLPLCGHPRPAVRQALGEGVNFFVNDLNWVCQ